VIKIMSNRAERESVRKRLARKERERERRRRWGGET
jgi:hypothetical protein